MSRHSSLLMQIVSCRIAPAGSFVAVAMLTVTALGAQTPPQGATEQSGRELVVTAGKSLIVNSAVNIERVAVGFGDVAEARAVGPKEVLLDGKAPGETSLIIWQQGGNKLFFDVVVRPSATPARTKLENLRRRIAEEVQQPIDVSIDGENVFLRGTVKDLVTAQRAVAIASTAGKVTNLLYVNVPPTDAQILLKVRFATVDRSVTNELGLNLFSTGATNTVGRVTTGQFSPPGTAQGGSSGGSDTFTISDALNFFLFRRDLNLGATIKALESRGMVEILAEPNVLAINGKQASFLAGGEFPYPILQGGQGGIGTVTVAFREFGVRINFLPVLTPRGTIRLDVAPEVSSLDYAAGLTVQGFIVPGLATRKVETEIELEAGQSFAIGGLLDRRLTETIAKVPLLSSVPLLGKLFQSRLRNHTNNELLVIVTPELVRPVAADKAPKLNFPYELPGDDRLPRTPGLNETGPAPSTQGERVPVEQLVQQLKTESEMKLKQGQQLTTWPSSQPLPAPEGLQPQTPAPPVPPAAPPVKK